nr:myelin-associated glycoprotein-like [Misgurnus anguillicaudatus]
MLQIILLLLPGVLCTEVWNVTHPSSICGVRGSNVTIPCNFKYPTNPYLQVTEVSWCAKKESDKCGTEGPYVYNSSHTNIQNNFQYTGDNISDCSLLISNINSTSSGEYLFRFITNSPVGRFTKPGPGANVTVTDLKVSMTKLGDNENITVGDSLNLTCNVSCPGHLPELQWLKDHQTIPHTGPILTFRSVTPEDSGNYSCSLKNFKSSESEQIRLYVEGSVFPETSWSTTLFWVGNVVGVCLVLTFIIAAVILIIRSAKTEQQKKDSTIYTTVIFYEVKGEMLTDHIYHN